MIGCGLVARVEIGAEVVARDAGRGLDLEDVLGGQRIAPRQPARNGTLGNPEQRSHCRLRADSFDRVPERLRCLSRCHAG